jgi:glucokinase
MNFAIGVDLGGTNLRVAALGENGAVLERLTTGTKASLGRDAVITEMTAAISQLAAAFTSSHRLAGVGIGVPGIIDAHSGMLRESPNLPGWNDYPVRAEIEQKLGYPVLLENDANAAALGESWLGAARNAESMAMVTLGTGVGGGLLLQGQLWRGSRGMAGEFGHITVDPNGPRCNCGNYGCVEQFASATAIVRMAREMISRGEAPELARAAANHTPEFSAQAIHSRAMMGDAPAQSIFRKVGWALGVLLADLVNALNLQVYVIGGGVSNAWASFAPAMFDELNRRSFVYRATAPDGAAGALSGAAATDLTSDEAPHTTIARAALGPDAGLFGAARLALNAVP